jgi:hypothetical protein
VPGPLITRQDVANGAISGQPRKFAKIGGKSRAARVFFYFKSPNYPESMPHSLGRKPTGWKVVSISRDETDGTTAPGVVYAPLNFTTAGTGSEASSVNIFTRNYVVLRCTTANTWAEVEVF